MVDAATSPRELLPKMSPEDRERYVNDLALYGRAVMQQKEDGSVVYIPPERWLEQMKPKWMRRP